MLGLLLCTGAEGNLMLLTAVICGQRLGKCLTG